MSVINRLQREWRLIIQDPGLIVILFLAPLFYTVLYGSFYVNKTEYKVPMAVVDNDHSAYSRALIQKADAHPVLQVVSMGSLDEAMNALKHEQVHGILYIEPEFEKHIKQVTPATVKLYLNNTKFLVSNDMNRAVNDAAMDIDAAVKKGLFAKAGYAGTPAEILMEPIRMDIHNIYNQAETYGAFILPGLMILILAQVMFISIGQNMGKERETGTLIHHHGSRHEAFGALTAKMILYSVVFSVYFAGILIFLFPQLGVYPTGDMLTILGMFVLFIITQAAFCMFVSTFFSTKLSGLLLVSLTSYPVFLISGYAFPAERMPEYMSWIAQILPTTAFLNMLSNLLFIQTSITAFSNGIVHLLILLLVYSAAIRFRLQWLLK